MSWVQPVDQYLKMLSTDAILVPPIKRCASCKGCKECKKSHLPDPARQKEQVQLIRQNLFFDEEISRYRASYVYNNRLQDLPVYEAACKRVPISL